MIDIYDVDVKEGFFLAKELEKLRRKKDIGKIVVTCKRETSDEIKQYKRAFLLCEGTTHLFSKAKAFYVGIGEQDIFFDIEAETCHIVYKFTSDVNWKIIDLEIVDKEMKKEIIINKEKKMGRAEVYAFLMLASFAYKYGYTNVFDENKKGVLNKLFEDISKSNDLEENEFGLESKVSNMVFETVMRPEFSKLHSPIFKN